jgi:hypothetical protein
MPRIASLDLNQINRQFETMDTIQAEVNDVQTKLSNVGQSISIADPIHAPSTTNNFAFTWTGTTQVLSWNQAFIKDKNWNTQTLASPTKLSSAKGQQHIYTAPAGSLNLNPSTYYWLGWDTVHHQLVATTNADQLHGNFNVHIISQIYTGTTGQTGMAGGGGSNGGVDLSGLTYKNF